MLCTYSKRKVEHQMTLGYLLIAYTYIAYLCYIHVISPNLYHILVNFISIQSFISTFFISKVIQSELSSLTLQETQTLTKL